MTNNTNQSNLKRQIVDISFKNAMVLGVFAVVSTGLIAITNALTKDKISKEVERSLVRKLSIIVPPENYNNEVYSDCIKVNDQTLLGSVKSQKIYRMRQEQNPYAAMITTIAPEGYSGAIKIALAIDVSGEILGVNILQHSETPGLGDKIERRKSNWLNQFNGKSLVSFPSEKWKVKKDGGNFDALTGATITPRAVVKAIHNTLIFLDKENSAIYSKISNCRNQSAKKDNN